jgi:hypothetical protein
MNAIKSFVMIAIASLAIAGGASAALAATPTFPAFAGPPSKDNPVVRPAAIIYSGDSSQFFAGAGAHRPGKLHWTVWNSTEGLGSGENWINNCTPSCANGTFSQYPVTLKVYRVKRESKFRIFTRLTVTFTGTRPVDSRRTFTWKVSYGDGFFEIG